MKKRVYFNKFDEMRFISHLDLLRFLERIFIKGEIPVKYSQGFHPRPKISLGNPVSLGTEAFNEVMEIELEFEITNEELMERLNALNIIGFKVTKVEECIEKTSIVERFNTAIYKIKGQKNDIDAIETLLKQDNIIERKEKKGKIVERDLKEKISSVLRNDDFELEINLSNGSPNIYIELAGVSLVEVEITKYGYIQI